MAEKYQISEVLNRKTLKKFLRLPDDIYQNRPHFIKPLHLHTQMMLGPLKEKNKHLFLAERNGTVVARIAIKTITIESELFLHYGFFECTVDHPNATIELFEHAQKMYPKHVVKGPYHFQMEEPYVGTLIKGFSQDPYIFMPYNPDYYDEYLKNAGLEKAMDLLTYDLDLTSCPEKIQKIARRGEKRGVSVRWIEPKRLKEEVTIIADIFNDSLSDNWGFEPITDDQLDEMLMVFKYVIDPRLVCFIVKDGKEIGCSIALPNLNPIIRLAKGRLHLAFIWKLFTQRRKFKTARGYALGMRKGSQGTGNVCQLVDALYRRGVEIGIERVEISWVLENNRPMTQMSQSIGGRHNKTYRIYEKPALQ